jgi:hypothetical protein
MYPPSTDRNSRKGRKNMNPESSAVPIIACVPSAIEASERPKHFALARQLLGEPTARRETLSNGLAFRLQPDSLETVARFVANERKCCPFMTFNITVEPNDGAITLQMTGPVGTREVLEAELNLQASCGCK